MKCTIAIASLSMIGFGFHAWAQTAPDALAETPAAPEREPQSPERPTRSAASDRNIPDSIQLVRDVVYATATTDSGEPIELKFDAAFLKESDGKPMPVIVYIHGGGWRGGSKELGLRANVALAMGGYFAVSIQYRLSDEAIYPAAVHDCKAAIRFLRANAEELGIDPNRIGVWGHSAGGHLAALLATSGNSDVLNGKVGDVDHSTSTAVKCAAVLCGPTDLSRDIDQGMISQWFGGPVRDRQETAKQASPITYIDANDPPMLLVHGTEDRLVNIDRHARPFETELKEAGVDVEFLPVEGAGHNLTNPRIHVRVAEFFDEQLGGKATAAVQEFLRDAVRQQERPERPREGNN